MRYYTKSTFNKALFCETTLNYVGDDKYIDISKDNSFLASLAEGGYQVEYLAKAYYPDGIDMKDYDMVENTKLTKQYIAENENVILFEPMFIHDGFLLRADILIKKGNTLFINEVKAKSFNFKQGISQFVNKRSKGRLKKEWSKYVFDVYFQKYVIECIYPQYNVSANLMLCDKDSVATVDGLNQKFLVTNGTVDENKEQELGESIMGVVCLDELFENTYIQEGLEPMGIENTMNEFEINGEKMHVNTFIELTKKAYINKIKFAPCIGSKCKTCTFYSKTETSEQKSGFLECWNTATKLSKDVLSSNQTVLDIWNYRQKDKLIGNDQILCESVEGIDSLFGTSFEQINNSKESGLSQKERQFLQVYKVQQGDNSIYVDKVGLRDEMNSWKYPLNMIDFETSAVAIPFNKDISPYESVAFQFSHHLINEDGTVEHKTQYLDLAQGHFPSFDFVRALKRALEKNEGSIFKYSPHENSILNLIYRQLFDGIGKDEEDRDELLAFIETVTSSNTRTTSNTKQSWCGERDMVDLWAVLKKYYYNPITKGSNSIKDVLPAILESSDFLRTKYSKPVYGTSEFPSLNIKDKVWLKFDVEGKVINPYKQLSGLFEDIPDDMLDKMIASPKLANGGEAMIAYAKCQFTQMLHEERMSIWHGLLKYCELDTLAMCLIYEHWRYDLGLFD